MRRIRRPLNEEHSSKRVEMKNSSSDEWQRLRRAQNDIRRALNEVSAGWLRRSIRRTQNAIRRTQNEDSSSSA